MYLESGQLLQLTFAVLAAALIFFGAYAAPLRISVGILLVLIPFQPVSTSLGSANVIMTYVLAGALLVRGRLNWVPMLGVVMAVILAYLVSMSQVPRSVYVLHGVEIIALVSSFLVFFLTYNLAREVDNKDLIIKYLLWANVIALLYCMVQIIVGPGQTIEIFSSRDFMLNKNRGDGDARLVGPFSTAGLTAAYFMTMTLILVYKAITSTGWRRMIVVAVAVANVAMIMATANRGSFLVLCAGMLGFMYLFRAELGFSRIVQIVAVSTVILFGSATLIASYTDFGQMFDRLATTTEIKDGVPKTRSALWPVAWEHIKEKPIIGHGPRVVTQTELRYRSVPDEQLVSTFPHNLYLHLLVTVGVLGTFCMLFFLFGVLWRVYQGSRLGSFKSSVDRGWVAVGIIVIGTILIDELKIEFLRFTTVDYAHFIFAVFGMFLGWADQAIADARSQTATAPRSVQPAGAGRYSPSAGIRPELGQSR